MNLLYRYSHIIILFVYTVFIICLEAFSFYPVFDGRIGLVSASIFFGFTMSSLSIILTLDGKGAFKTFCNKQNSAPEIFITYISTLKYLGLLCCFLIALNILNVDKLESLSPLWPLLKSRIHYITIFMVIKSIEKMFWNFFILNKIIKIIQDNWRQERQEFIKEAPAKLRALYK